VFLNRLAPRSPAIRALNLHRFLHALANRGYSDSRENEDEPSETFHWFQNHRLFSTLLPRDPDDSPEEQFQRWRLKVRDLWSEAEEWGPDQARVAVILLFTSRYAPLPEEFTLAEMLRGWPDFSGVPRFRGADGFLRALIRLWHLAPRLRRCRNTDCEHPFFFLTPEHEHFCSRACARQGELTRKRRSWQKNKRQWRPLKSKLPKR
jgi:hypothetical protein